MRSFHSICILNVHFNVRCECNQARTRDACQCWVWITNKHTSLIFRFSFCCFHVSFFTLHWKQTLFCKHNLTQVRFYWFKTQVSSSYARGRKYDGGSRSLSRRSPPDRLGAERSQNTVHCQACKGRSPPGHPFRLTGSRSHFLHSTRLAPAADWHLYGQPQGTTH